MAVVESQRVGPNSVVAVAVAGVIVVAGSRRQATGTQTEKPTAAHRSDGGYGGGKLSHLPEGQSW